ILNFDFNKMPEYLKYILTLTVICLITASFLTGVYLLTHPKIIEQQAQEQAQALKAVLPGAGLFEPVRQNEQVFYFKGYASRDKKKLLGYAFKARGQGYSGAIEVMAGMDRQGTITGIKILAQNETPGLGARINEVLQQQTLWEKVKQLFSKSGEPEKLSQRPWFLQQFQGKKVKDFKKNIQAITGATISSEALTNAVREQAGKILENVQ
ncbi:MAG: RnfABCDGE type electron transport complex subunit G, partial [Candidatus Omnitrophica bacterium]|nr:RnfABCDGE type electron transport complex subunit G [Candidatus Omnitrophota bacterium]